MKTSLWLSVDPLAEITMTPYQYTSQNPINYIDPTGMSGENPDASTAGCPPGVECLDEIVITKSLSNNSNPPIQDYNWFKDLNLNDILKNGAFFDNPVNAFNLMAIESLYKKEGDEFSAYILQDCDNDEFAYINPHYKDGKKINSMTSSYNSKLSKKEDGYYLEIKGKFYKVLYQVHTHPGGKLGGEWPSFEDLEVNDKFFPVFYFNETNVRRAETRNWRRNINGALINPNTILGTQLDLLNGKIKF